MFLAGGDELHSLNGQGGVQTAKDESAVGGSNQKFLRRESVPPRFDRGSLEVAEPAESPARLIEIHSAERNHNALNEGFYWRREAAFPIISWT